MIKTIPRESLSGTLLCFVLMFILIWNGELFFPNSILKTSIEYTATDGLSVLGEKTIAIFATLSPMMLAISCFVVMFFNALFLVRLILRSVILANRIYFPALVFLVYGFSSGLTTTNLLGQFIVLFLLYSFENLLNIVKKKSFSGLVFNGAFFLGVISLFFIPSLMLWPIALIAPSVFAFSSFRNIIIAMIALVAPSLLYSYWMWVFDGYFGAYYENIVEFFTTYWLRYDLGIIEGTNIVLFGFLGITVTLLVWAIVYFARNIHQMNIKTINSVTIFLLSMFFIITGWCLFPVSLDLFLSLLSVPISILLSIVLLSVRKRWIYFVTMAILLLLAITISTVDF